MKHGLAKSCDTLGCSKPSIFFRVEGNDIRHYCEDHVWEKTQIPPGDTRCDKLFSSGAKCRSKATIKWINIAEGTVRYWCEPCRRAFYPTQGEHEADEQKNLRKLYREEKLRNVVSTIFAVCFCIGIVALLSYLVVAFVHWSWRNS
jgi:hypothetical protein